MKLDNVIYDIGTLGSAIQSDLIKDSVTFNAMYPSQTASALVNTLAGYGSMLQYTLVSAMANAYTDTAYSPTGIHQLAETLGNKLHGNISSQLKCKITRTNLRGIADLTIPAGTVFDVEGQNFFNKELILFPINEDTVSNVVLVQGKLITVEKIASGLANERYYFAEDFKCNTNMVTVTVNDVEWNLLDSFIESTVVGAINEEEIQSFVLRTDPDGRTYIKTSSNSSAQIPSAGSVIKITYASNDGSTGNIENSDLDISLTTPIYYTLNTGISEQLKVAITNSTPASGGYDTQSLDTLKESSPYVFASGNRAIRRNDYKAMLLNKCGYITANVWGEYEQAEMYGGYDKIMMNMVYYSGIKSIQEYNLKPIQTINISTNIIKNLVASQADIKLNNNQYYYELDGDVLGARGFLGSYQLEIQSYDANSNLVSVKYNDEYGTGITTFSPILNKDIIEESSDPDYQYNYYKFDDITPDVQNNTPTINLYMGNITSDSGVQYNVTDKPANWDNGKCLFGLSTKPSGSPYQQFISTGKVDGNKVLMTYNNPLQIAFSYYNTSALGRILHYRYTADVNTAGSGYAAGDTCSTSFINAGTIYIDEVDNNGGIVKFHMEHIAGSNPVTQGSSAELTATFNLTPLIGSGTGGTIDITSIKIEVSGGTIAGIRFKAHDDDNYLDNFIGKFAIYGSRAAAPSFDNIKNSSDWVKLTDIQEMSDDIKSGKWSDYVTLNTYDVETGKWTYYYHYVIEIYSVRNNKLTTMPGCQVAIGQIKAIYGDQYALYNDLEVAGSASTIQYGDNNSVKLRIPLSDVVTGYTAEYSSLNNAGLRYCVNDSVYVPNGFTNLEMRVTEINDFMTTGTTLTDNMSYYTLTSKGSITSGGGGVDTPFAVGDIVYTDLSGTIANEVSAYFKVTSVTPDTGAITNIEFYEDQPETTDTEKGHGKFATDPTSASGLSLKLFNPGSRTPAAATIVNYTSLGVGKIKTLQAANKGFYLSSPGTTGVNTITNSLFGSGAKVNLTVSTANNAPAFPNNMQFYEYTAIVTGATLLNGYTSSDSLEYVANTYYGTYTFRVNITNSNTGECLVKIIRQGDSTQYSALRGKEPINIDNAPLSYISGTSGAGVGATITISSTSTVNLYANYTGNYYSDSDIQMNDIPVIEKYNHFTTYLEFKQPRAKNVDIEINVEYENNVTASEVKNNIINAVHSIFNITPYYIGKTLSVSDIWKAVNSVDGVKRFIVTTPVENIECKPYEFIVLPSNGLVINDISNYNTYQLTPRD